MANVVKKDGGQQNQGGRSQNQPQGELVRRDPFGISRDPLQMMMQNPLQLMREMMIDPFRMLQLSPLFGRGELNWSPSFEVRETDDAFLFKADVPGLRTEDVEISLVGNQLQIEGKREHEREQDEGRYHAYERSYGSFQRSFTLPESADLDNIRSDLENGVLTLVVPKQPGAKTQRKRIQIGSGSKS